MKGAPGPLGSPGSRGPSGPSGERGDRGDKGNPGPQGPQGPMGGNGLKGEKGPMGHAGSDGRMGIKGEAGRDGRVGPAGRDGMSGPTGERGVQGLRGEAGVRGSIGYSGESGDSGDRGPRGLNGPSGPAGPPGPPGPVLGGGRSLGTQFSSQADQAAWIKVAGTESIAMPKGTKESPARTCRHLAQVNKYLPDGLYWIDPNGGRMEDAVQVHCNIMKQETCISAKTQVSRDRWFNSPLSKPTWFTEKTAIGEFQYHMETSQLSHLQLWSTSAVQKITLECKNAAILTGASFYADNGYLISQGNKKFRYNVLKDDCQYKTSAWSESVVEVRTRQPKRLPVRDMAVSDAGQDSQSFGFALGDVCFA